MPRHLSPTIPMSRRISSHAEVELGLDAATAIAEAQRCLMCGPCSECLACELVCEPGAILHDQLEHIEELEVGAIIWAARTADAREAIPGLKLPAGAEESQMGFYRVQPDDPLAGSASAARIMLDLFTERRPAAARSLARAAVGAARVGVFICQCNGQISEIIDTAALQGAAGTWPGVTYTQVLAQSCSADAAGAIYQAVADQNLNRVVLAACSCCATDQVCYSCTYQRVRCKDHLLGRHFDPGSPLFEFVNIREHCAWAHEDEPAAATATASAMIAAAVAKTRLSTAPPEYAQPLDKIVLILGSGQAATVCQEALSAQSIQALQLPKIPAQVRQTPDHFTATMNNGNRWSGSAVILAPRDAQEHAQIQAAFEPAGRQPRIHAWWGAADTHRPGVFMCDPAAEPTLTGRAAAARAAAWLGHEHPWPAAAPYEVDPQRCRGCGDCELVCEFGAIQLQGEGETRVAWIDPWICQGDGTCAARCPAGAITTGHLTSMQLDAMLEALLA